MQAWTRGKPEDLSRAKSIVRVQCAEQNFTIPYPSGMRNKKIGSPTIVGLPIFLPPVRTHTYRGKSLRLVFDQR